MSNENIKMFLKEFQDLYVTKKTSIDLFPGNITEIELRLINTQLQNIYDNLEELSSLTLNASREISSNYKNIIQSLEDKINYISDTADIFFKINSFFDNTEVKDVFNYNLKEVTEKSSTIFDDFQKGITLQSEANAFKCPSNIENNILTFYNTNFCYHSGINIESNYLDLLKINSISIKKLDGTVLNLTLPKIDAKSIYIKHDLLTSSQVIIEFQVNPIFSGNPEYYQDLKMSLIDYDYKNEGYFVLEPKEYESSDIFNLITDYEIPNHCFINTNLDINLLDINKNIVFSTVITLPIGNSLVCKRLDNIDLNQIDVIEGLYVKNKFSNKNLTKTYIESLLQKNEKYIIYKAKQEEILEVNNYIKVIDSLGFNIINKHVKYLDISTNIELFSFNEKSSPTIQLITGVSKSETI